MKLKVSKPAEHETRHGVMCCPEMHPLTEAIAFMDRLDHLTDEEFSAQGSAMSTQWYPIRERLTDEEYARLLDLRTAKHNSTSIEG